MDAAPIGILNYMLVRTKWLYFFHPEDLAGILSFLFWLLWCFVLGLSGLALLQQALTAGDVFVQHWLDIFLFFSEGGAFYLKGIPQNVLGNHRASILGARASAWSYLLADVRQRDLTPFFLDNWPEFLLNILNLLDFADEGKVFIL